MELTFEQLAIEAIKNPGTYRVRPFAWTLFEPKDSNSKAITFHFSVQEQWCPEDKTRNTPEGWSAAWPPGYFVTANVWIIGKDGNLNEGNVQRLMKCGLWDGDFDELARPPRWNTIVMVEADNEEYQGKTQLKGQWINPNADRPQARGFQPANPESLSALRARFGSQTRAIAGGARAGSPPAPGAASAPANPMQQQAPPPSWGTPAPTQHTAPTQQQPTQHFAPQQQPQYQPQPTHQHAPQQQPAGPAAPSAPGAPQPPANAGGSIFDGQEGQGVKTPF